MGASAQVHLKLSTTQFALLRDALQAQLVLAQESYKDTESFAAGERQKLREHAAQLTDLLAQLA